MAEENEDEAKLPMDKPPHVAKPGVDDSDSIVTGAGGELMSGRIADIADGDT